ncbi:hypothetical protein ElyMa_001047800 [Elysia marginata]|uniref:Uncharacterized protein n=1 Tax=Elysia marginata TaxID=1093978 RepID=A0AAV4HNR4_9GAST|nr:hypothetical protein ElyMa_001047800 [Elysia marginata]
MKDRQGRGHSRLATLGHFTEGAGLCCEGRSLECPAQAEISALVSAFTANSAGLEDLTNEQRFFTQAILHHSSSLVMDFILPISCSLLFFYFDFA